MTGDIYRWYILINLITIHFISFFLIFLHIRADVIFCRNMKQGAFDFKVTSALRAGSCYHDQVKTPNKFFLIQTIAFPDQSGQTMSYDTVSDFFAYRYAKPVSPRISRVYVHDKISVSE